ncbi:T9SS type A sorting domain-containing protein [Flavobacterium sp.]|uniref:T9SS type A sorting domain-containing protein n=1 Tax=Flavobacterium sp. TaxID=239 RepID=UPI00333F000E
MKHPSKILIFGCLLTTYFSNAQDILWEKSYGGKHAEYLFDAQATPDYGFILAGSSISGKTGNKEDANKGDLDYWLWKMDEKGDLDWQKSFGGSGVDLLYSVKLTADGGFILAGISNSNKGLDKKADAKGQDDFWIIKLDAKGNELWQQTIGGSGQEKLQTICQTRDGGYVIGGTSASYKTRKDDKGVLDVFGKSEDTRGNLDYWIVKLKKDGKIEWQKTLGGSYVDELKDLVVLPNGNILAGGYSNSPESGDKTQDNYGMGDFWLVELSTEGQLVWQQTIGAEADDNLFAIELTFDGGFMVGGNSNSASSAMKSKASKNGSDFWILKFDKDKMLQWQETYDYGTKDVLTSIVENKDGSFLIGGYAQSEQTNEATAKFKKADKEGINDYIALKINANGEEIWTQTAGSKGEEVLKKLFETRDGGYLLAGTSNGYASKDKNSTKGGADFWVVKLKDNTKPENEKAPIEAIPNPAVTFTNVIIGFEYENGTANLYDISGRLLQTYKLDGSRTLPVEMSSYPTGMYIVELVTDKEKNSVKILKK